MSITHRTNAESVLAVLKLTGMAAALSFIMTLVLAGCPIEPDPESGGGGELTGSVSITGFAKVDGTLTADISALAGSGTVSYEWKRGGSSAEVNDVISGASGAAYTPVQADLGKYLTVTVTRAGYTGSKTSPATAQVLGADAVEPTVSGVTVSPKTASVQKGGTLQFSAGVAGTGLDGDPAYKAVTWTVTGGSKAGTSISASGLLTVAADEMQTSLTIKAVSALNSGKNDTAAVSVIEALPPVSVDELADYVADLPDNSTEDPWTPAIPPHTVKLKRTNITTNGVMSLVNEGVANRYVVLDLSDCYATNNMISGKEYTPGISDPPGINDMNVIKGNQYIVGIILPDELRIIGDSAFYGCSSLTSVTIPGSVISIAGSAFSGCGNLRFTVTGAGGFSIRESDKMLIRKDNTELIAYPSASGAVTIPSDITSIGWSAFSGCSSLESVTIPSSVTSIGGSAFSECSSLESVIIPDSVTSIGNSAFSGCSSLASVTIPSGVASIGDRAFSKCYSLESIVIPEGVTSIGESTFHGCSSLASVTIPASVTSIGYGAFSWCDSLASVTFAEESSITSANFSVYNYLPGDLRYKYFNEGGGAGTYTMTQPGNSPTWTKEFLTISGSDEFLGVHITGLPANTSGNPHTVKLAPVNISTNGVMNNIRDLVWGKYVILDLSDCSASNNTISGSSTHYTPGPNNMNVIRGNQYIVGIILPGQLTSIGYSAFYGCSSLVSITIPEGVESIGDSAFYGCSSLASVTIPASVISIGEQAFDACFSLASVTFDEGSDISEDDFAGGSSGNLSFPGDLRDKYLAAGGAGTYTQSSGGSTWTKQ